MEKHELENQELADYESANYKLAHNELANYELANNVLAKIAELVKHELAREVRTGQNLLSSMLLYWGTNLLKPLYAEIICVLFYFQRMYFRILSKSSLLNRFQDIFIPCPTCSVH